MVKTYFRLCMQKGVRINNSSDRRSNNQNMPQVQPRFSAFILLLSSFGCCVSSAALQRWNFTFVVNAKEAKCKGQGEEKVLTI